MIEVIDSGLLTTMQDLGRPGFGAIGVPPSGAVDRESLIAANLLVGNSPGAACLETTLTGVRLRVEVTTLGSVTGAPATVRVNRSDVPFGTVFAIPAGSELEVGRALIGVRSYVAFAGGLLCEPVLGSRSTDLLTGLGPAPLAPTTRIALGQVPAGPSSGARPDVPDVAADAAVRVIPGPRDGHFDPDAIERLAGAAWTASPVANRIGVRLEGDPIRPTAGAGSLRSEGLVTGAIQIPPSGSPTVMLTDRPTTGGYPVIAVVAEEDLRLIGQLRPGSSIRFLA